MPDNKSQKKETRVLRFKSIIDDKNANHTYPDLTRLQNALEDADLLLSALSDPKKMNKEPPAANEIADKTAIKKGVNDDESIKRTMRGLEILNESSGHKLFKKSKHPEIEDVDKLIAFIDSHSRELREIAQRKTHSDTSRTAQTATAQTTSQTTTQPEKFGLLENIGKGARFIIELPVKGAKGVGKLLGIGDSKRADNLNPIEDGADTQPKTVTGPSPKELRVITRKEAMDLIEQGYSANTPREEVSLQFTPTKAVVKTSKEVA